MVFILQKKLKKNVSRSQNFVQYLNNFQIWYFLNKLISLVL
jgi:hypothetical protein